MNLLLGTKNKGKIREAKSILGSLDGISLLTYEDRPFPEVIEDGNSFEENSYKKASVISEHTGLSVLAEDSGLEVEGLGGRPGIYSARFAGENASDEANNEKLLAELESKSNRKARFVTVATLYFTSSVVGVEFISTRGELIGKVAYGPRGDSGFGYDPLFIPDGYSKTLAQLGPTVKNKISHRRKALDKTKEKLRNILGL